jgi:chromosome segregation ATPase
MDQIELCVTELLGRLHDCEVERCGLQSRLTDSDQELKRLREACHQINVLQTTVKRLENSDNVIPKEAYDRLIAELQRKQQYAKDQEGRVKELTQRTEHMRQDLLRKEATLAQAIKDLADMKMEIQRQGESGQQLSRRISKLKEDKWSLKNQLQSCQVSCQAATREKDVILEYLLSVDKALQTVLKVEYVSYVIDLMLLF